MWAVFGSCLVSFHRFPILLRLRWLSYILFASCVTFVTSVIACDALSVRTAYCVCIYPDPERGDVGRRSRLYAHVNRLFPVKELIYEKSKIVVAM